MNALCRIFIVLLCSGCAGLSTPAETEKPKAVEMFSLGSSHFAIHEDYQLHPITPIEWGKRSALGIPVDARKCGGPYYLYFKVKDGERGSVIGLVTEDKQKKLRAVEPLMYFSDKQIETSRLFVGLYVQYGQSSPFGNYLFVTPMQFDTLIECATRNEANT